MLRREPERWKLLPRWIRVFSWFFLLALVAIPVLHVAGIFYKGPMSFMIFGFNHSGAPSDPPALAIQAVLGLLGVAAFGLLWGKPWGLNAGVAAGVLGLGAVAVSTVLAWSSGRFVLQFEPFFQVPFLIALARRRPAWDGQLDRNAA